MNKQPKILVVEDDDDLRELLGEALENAGYRTELVSGYCEATRALETDKFDLVALDLMLPDGDGMEICDRAVNPRDGGSGAAVLVLSGRNSIECKLKSFMTGARRFVSKPFEIDELISAVKETLKGHCVAAAPPPAPLPGL
ncbi:MAG: Swarming motility regulation protein RssB [bacterium ADurb.Bin236]|nr:MAG: Swarming motility regulation protein RssB [bacterium ADurb.Bin236]